MERSSRKSIQCARCVSVKRALVILGYESIAAHCVTAHARTHFFEVWKKILKSCCCFFFIFSG